MSHLRVHAGFAMLAATAVAAASGPPPMPFEEATMFVEQNATDGDTEVVISGTAGDDGLQLLTIKSPDGRTMATLRAPDLSTLGMREFHFESPEPPGEAVLAAYPEGKYVLRGVSTTGEVFRTVLNLSHQLPAAATILHPADEAELPARQPLTIRWSKVTGVAGYVLEFENESADPEQALTIDLGPNVTSWRIPAALLPPGGEFQIGIHSIAENGNIVVVEQTFTTGE
ncbi:MAG: hypothetical protein ACREVI_11920 [Steroidobacteraceae bacterium]